MIEIKDKSQCSGCSACYAVCPKKCIDMKADNEGYLYPQVNTVVCNNCNLCEKICPISKPIEIRDFETLAFAAQIKDKKIRLESASGGLFTAIAYSVLEKHGVVFGACYDENFMVEHNYASTKEELSKFRSSKYVQSDMKDIFSKAKQFLDENKLVLFAGTPCQMNGFRSFLRKKYDNLILLDFVCRGTPSPKILKKYLQHNEFLAKSKLNYVSFRDKRYGYAGSTMALGFENGKKLYSGRDLQFFKHTFFEDLNSRPSCFKCHFKTIKREADITLFDCWHVNEFDKSMDDDKGTTMVLLHSEKGNSVFEEIKATLKYCPANVEKAIKLDGIMVENSTIPNTHREDFFNDIDKLEVPQLIEKYFPLSMKKRLVFLFKPMLYKIGLLSLLKRFLN
ncbi:MAG: Coenzyme F420 hydrogenase/dehydrogenase, beta subunit C-terminal domain [Bacteroidetes bacterium]|nr:Coenzyme F420 hydrogenase/dehydrogenase, beta subunit C-terminal domain [Bacteroidota bacterium]